MKETGILLDINTRDFDIKIIRDAEGKIRQGLHVGNITNQNISIILYMQPGELKEQPTVGVGINNMILDHDYLLYKHKIRQQLNAEGMQINYLEINGQKIEIDANYE